MWGDSKMLTCEYGMDENVFRRAIVALPCGIVGAVVGLMVGMFFLPF